jgi:hypothetical protein
VAWWIFVLLLYYATERWVAVDAAIRLVMLSVSAVGLLVLSQTGLLPVTSSSGSWTPGC